MPDRSFSSDDPTPSACPRCFVRLPPVDLVKHLWLEHRLLLDEGIVREPWQLIQAWILRYCRTGEPELLQRCRLLGQRADPEHGLLRVQRLFLAYGVEDAESRQRLLEAARQSQSSVCPACYALVPAHADAPVRPLDVSPGRLAGAGYRIEIARHRLWSYLEIETPAGLLYSGREPGRHWTYPGALFGLVGPLVLLALVLAFCLPAWNIPPVVPVAFLLLTALVVFGVVHYFWRDLGTPADRVVDHAWTMLVPRLQASGLPGENTAFVAALALTSAAGHGRPERRALILQQFLNETRKAVATGTGSVTQLAALWRLAAADAARTGGDPVLLLVTQAGYFFDAKLPVAFVEQLLAGYATGAWAAGNLVRLRVLLCERAFEAGLEVRDLLTIAQAAPALAAILRTDDPNGLAQLRLLWSLRPSQPWDRCGPAVTVFELAAEGRTAALEVVPDLLWRTQGTPAIFVCGRGLIFQGKLFKEPARGVEIRPHGRGPQLGYELKLDDRTFWFPEDPEILAKRLDCWFRYLFNDFLPAAGPVYRWQSPHAPELSAQAAGRCPECGKALLTRIGDMAIPLKSNEF